MSAMEASLRSLLAAAGAVFDTENTAGAPLHFGDWTAEYAALTGAAGLVDMSDRTQIELAGADRQSFLHNFCTNEVRRLNPGAGCEAFLCNVQGHTLACVHFLRRRNAGRRNRAETRRRVAAAFGSIPDPREVELQARDTDWAELLLAGPAAEGRFSTISIGVATPFRLFDHVAAQIGGVAVAVPRVDFTQPHGFLISCPRRGNWPVCGNYSPCGARPCGSNALEAARIEAGTPYYGVDLSEANLPQETGRPTHAAISFTKGCYIGQEPWPGSMPWGMSIAHCVVCGFRARKSRRSALFSAARRAK